MREIGEVRFETNGVEENRRFVERYVLEAVERLPELAFCDRVAFMPLSHEAVGGSNVWITVAGDLDALVDHESGTWDALVDEGLVAAWTATETTAEWYENAGERGGALLFRLHHVANQMTRAAYEEFDERPAPVDTYPDEESKHPIGWWMTLEAVTGHQGYSLDERADAFLYAIRRAYDDVTEFESPENAVDNLDDTVRALEALRADLRD